MEQHPGHSLGRRTPSTSRAPAGGDGAVLVELRGLPPSGRGSGRGVRQPPPCETCPLIHTWRRLAGDLERLVGLLVDETEFAALRRATPSVAAPVALPPGWADLTEKERRVARLLAAGQTDREIAGALGWTFNTAHSYSAGVRAKLGVRSRRHIAELFS